MTAIKVQLVSVRDSDGRGFMSQEFASLSEVRKVVPSELRGLSSYWQVRVFRGDEQIGRGYRSGPGGTGERWKWELPQD